MSFFYRIKKGMEKLQEDHISEYAAECAYFTILSFIPFIIFFLTLIQYTNIDKEIIFVVIREVIPSSMNEIILGVIDEMYLKPIGTISLAAITILWSSGKGFFSLCKGLRKIYGTDDDKSKLFLRLEGTIYTFLFIILIILFLFLLIFGNLIHNALISKFYTINGITSFIFKIKGLFLILIMFLVFLIIYRFVPRHKMKMNTQILGALFSSIAWNLISWCFSYYIDTFNGFSNMYGSLSSIILIMMWVYACMYIILLGAEINTIIRENKFKLLNNIK